MSSVTAETGGTCWLASGVGMSLVGALRSSLSSPITGGGGGYLERVLRNEGNFWYKVPCCCFLVDGYCYFLVASGWLLIFLDGLWMVADIS